MDSNNWNKYLNYSPTRKSLYICRYCMKLFRFPVTKKWGSYWSIEMQRPSIWWMFQVKSWRSPHLAEVRPKKKRGGDSAFFVDDEFSNSIISYWGSIYFYSIFKNWVMVALNYENIIITKSCVLGAYDVVVFKILE